MAHPYTADEIRELRSELAHTATIDLIEDFVSVTGRLEVGMQPDINPWEFRATWQELVKRRQLTAH